MKNLRKIRKNTKALSPVVASIILIAVTVAVSIAVAAWMGALTVGFMDTNSVTITDVAFVEEATPADNTDTLVLDVKNTGTSAVTIASAKVNGVAAAITNTPRQIEAGEIASPDVILTAPWTLGNAYKIDLYDNSGQLVGSYQATAA
jgi:flagellin-like protein